jgi:hypothetical protein
MRAVFFGCQWVVTAPDSLTYGGKPANLISESTRNGKPLAREGRKATGLSE